MDNDFEKRIRAAAGAGWVTILIFAIWMLLAWCIALAMMHVRPGWVLACCGGNVTWDTLQTLYLWFFGAIKMLLFVCLILVVWLTLWSRRLKRAA